MPWQTLRMSMLPLLKGLQHSIVGQAVRGEIGSEWLFPIIETLHVLAIATVYGSIVLVDLRLIGLASRGSAVSRLSAEMLPYTWGAFAVAAVTGSLMFMSKAATYFFNWAFDLKMLCIALAGLNMIVINLGAYRRVADWDIKTTPPSARVAGMVSILLWTAVIIFGRWIGFSLG